MYQGNWSGAKKGILTEGVLSPLLANIALSYVLTNVLISKKESLNANPLGLQGIMRFIDDLGGRWVGSVESFHKWVQWLNSCTKSYFIYVLATTVHLQIYWLSCSAIISFNKQDTARQSLFLVSDYIY